MEYIVLASGSKGNATILRSKNGIILIDLGITLTQFEKGLGPLTSALMMLMLFFILIIMVTTLNRLQNLMN